MCFPNYLLTLILRGDKRGEPLAVAQQNEAFRRVTLLAILLCHT